MPVEVTFEVEYEYYQNNSGAADNGYYTRRREVKTAEAALKLAARIEAAAQAHESTVKRELTEDEEEAERELHDDLIPYMGFFLKGKARALRVERFPVEQP